jgi:hypothetical protein
LHINVKASADFSDKKICHEEGNWFWPNVSIHSQSKKLKLERNMYSLQRRMILLNLDLDQAFLMYENQSAFRVGDMKLNSLFLLQRIPF